MPYPVLDVIERLAIGDKLPPADCLEILRSVQQFDCVRYCDRAHFLEPNTTNCGIDAFDSDSCGVVIR